MNMVRQKQRKSVEELYNTKFETTSTKSFVNNKNTFLPNNNRKGSNAPKTFRTDREYSSNYIIPTKTIYHELGHAALTMAGNTTGNRRKNTTARATSSAKGDRRCIKDKTPDGMKKDHGSRANTSRESKPLYTGHSACVPLHPRTMLLPTSSQLVLEKPQKKSAKDVRHSGGGGGGGVSTASATHPHQHAYSQTQASCHSHGHSHTHHQPVPDVEDDKDDDTEEFFQLIRLTVENAISRAIADLLNRNFREIVAKVDRFSAELKATNALISKMQTDVTKKITHYGEQNSRHFRYLCMKSEYDKMFYQNHAIMTGGTPAKQPSKPNAKSCENPCSCRANSTSRADPHKSLSSEEHNMSNKSSEMGVRDVIEHIQKFCAQMQMNDFKCADEPKGSLDTFRIEDALRLKLKRDSYDENDDSIHSSSDGMTPRSDGDLPTKFGGVTIRSGSTNRCSGNRCESGPQNGGGGDA